MHRQRQRLLDGPMHCIECAGWSATLWWWAAVCGDWTGDEDGRWNEQWGSATGKRKVSTLTAPQWREFPVRVIPHSSILEAPRSLTACPVDARWRSLILEHREGCTTDSHSSRPSTVRCLLSHASSLASPPPVYCHVHIFAVVFYWLAIARHTECFRCPIKALTRCVSLARTRVSSSCSACSATRHARRRSAAALHSQFWILARHR